MNIFICLLRGINVGGKNSIKMDALKSVFEKIGCQNVNTFIQSGNIVFIHQQRDSKILVEKIAGQILSDLGLKIPLMVLTLQKFKQIVLNNPLANDGEKEISFLHVSFLSGTSDNKNKETVINGKAELEEIAIANEAVYLYCPNGYGRTKLNNNFLENKLKVQATTRNWKTTLKLLEIASSYEP